jgi:hypothetical protein
MATTLDDVTAEGLTVAGIRRRRLGRRAREQGLSLTGPDNAETAAKTVLEPARRGLTGHAGHETARPRAGVSNIRNGTRVKAVLTEATGRVRSTSPGRARTFEPQIVKKRQGG